MYIRHGDVRFFKVDKLPEGLKKSDSKVFMNGSGGHDHYYDVGEWYPKMEGNFVIGYFVAYSNTKLFHTEHGCKKQGKVKITEPMEGVYQVGRQIEDTHTGMRQVID